VRGVRAIVLAADFHVIIVISAAELVVDELGGAVTEVGRVCARLEVTSRKTAAVDLVARLGVVCLDLQTIGERAGVVGGVLLVSRCRRKGLGELEGCEQQEEGAK